MKFHILAIAALGLAACGSAGGVGSECTTDADCAEGLECHMHEHDGEEDGEESDHGECEEADEDHDDDTGAAEE